MKGESFQSVVFSFKLYSALLCKGFSSVAVDGSKELGTFLQQLYFKQTRRQVLHNHQNYEKPRTKFDSLEPNIKWSLE